MDTPEEAVQVTPAELATALIRAGFFYPVHHEDARIAAEDILGLIEAGRPPEDG